MLVHVGSQDLGLGTPSSCYLARKISWNACKLLLLLLLLRRQTKTIRTSAYLRLWLRRGKADCYTPRRQLNSKAISFKLYHLIPREELTHDSKAFGGGGNAMYSNANVWIQTFDCCCCITGYIKAESSLSLHIATPFS